MARLNHLRFPMAPQAEDFRPRLVSPLELPGIMRRHILTGALGNVYVMLTTSIFLIAFGEILGVSVIQWGVLGAVTSFAVAMQVVSAHWSARLGNRKLLWWSTESTSRLLKAVGFGVAYIFYRDGHVGLSATWLIAMLCISATFGAASGPPWFSWLTDIIPEKIHGRFMGRRDLWMALVIVGACIPAGYIIDATPAGLRAEALSTIFLVGILFGVFDLALHRIIPEPPMAPDLSVSFRQRVLMPLLDVEFRPWLVFTGVWNFAMMLCGWLANVYFIRNLGIHHNYLGGAVVLIGVPFLAVVATSKWSGILVDRLGVKRLLIITYAMWATLPLLWTVATPQTALFWLSLSAAIGGAVSSPATNAANKLITRVPPPHQRAMYLAVSTCVASLAGGLGSLVGGCFLDALGSSHWTIWGMTLVPFQLLFLLSAALRLSSWLLLFRVKTPNFDQALNRKRAGLIINFERPEDPPTPEPRPAANQ